jgi:hypothetical protein
MSAGHHFAPPWSVEEQDGSFVVRDRNGQALSYVYFKGQRDRRLVGTLFTRDEARHLAAAVSKATRPVAALTAGRQTARSGATS